LDIGISKKKIRGRANVKKGRERVKLLTATSSDVYAQQLGAKRGPLFGDTFIFK